MARIIELRKRAEAMQVDELEEMIHEAFLKRQNLMWKRPIWDEEITRIDAWLLQHKLPLDILIAIWSRASFCESAFYATDANPEQKRLLLLSLKLSYQQFLKLPQTWQDRLRPLWGDWAAVLLEEEMEEAKRGTA